MDSNDSDYSSEDSYYTGDDSSTTSSVFGYFCNVCNEKGFDGSAMEGQFLQDVVILMDSNGENWIKCDDCGSAFHLDCWEMRNDQQFNQGRFVCCKYSLYMCPTNHAPLSSFLLHVTVMDGKQAALKKVYGRKPRLRSNKSSHKGEKLQVWTPQEMQRAIQRYNDGLTGVKTRKGYKAVAKEFGVPAETLRRRLTGPHQGQAGHLLGGKGVPRIFTEREEHNLSLHIIKFAQAGFPFTPSEIQSLAFEYADLNHIEGFSTLSKKAGRKWRSGFLKRYPNLKISTPKLLSVYRANCCNRQVVNAWFDIFEQVLEDHDIVSPLFVWNVDECGAIDTPKPKKVVVPVGQRPNQLAASEKGETTTFVTCANAAGLAMKPLVIHKGQKVMTSWLKDKPAGYVVGSSDNGWINKQLFLHWGEGFIGCLRKRGLLEDPDQKHLLLMDSHNSHTFNYKFMKLMNDHNIVVLAIPSHTSHALQPLDDVPFAQFKTRWYEAMRLQIRRSGAKKLAKSEFFGVFSPCWKEALTVRHIQAGFRHTGIWPVNRNRITDSKIAPSLEQSKKCCIELDCYLCSPI